MKHPQAEHVDRNLSQRKPRVATAPPRLVLHTTESGSRPGAARRMAETHPNPAHLFADPWSQELVQVIPLQYAARSLKHRRGDPETNHMGVCVQVEIFGWARETHTWPDSVVKWLGEVVVGPICDLAGIPFEPLRTHGEGEGIVLATTSSPVRMPWDGWRSFSGICGHQHVPGNDHWDPGRLDVAALVGYAQGRDGGGAGEMPSPRATAAGGSMHLVLDGGTGWLLTTDQHGLIVKNRIEDDDALRALTIVLGQPVSVPDGSLDAIPLVTTGSGR